jgi:peptidoglycan/LPS O-acetylase OafA/YrhL
MRPDVQSVGHAKHFQYRAAIDGLRGVAVLAVLGFHAFPEVVGGGYIGVDIFFVISGFLITGIIARQLMHEDFSFADFYWRRVRRLFPALVLVLATTLALGWFLLLPDEFKQLGVGMSC